MEHGFFRLTGTLPAYTAPRRIPGGGTGRVVHIVLCVVTRRLGDLGRSGGSDLRVLQCYEDKRLGIESKIIGRGCGERE